MRFKATPLHFVVFAVLVFTTQLTVRAQGSDGLTAANLRDACENLVLAVRGVQPISQEDPGAMFCLGYLAGWNQAMEGVQDKPYCLPEIATMQPGDLADLLVSFVDENPDRSEAAAHEVMLEVFSEAFPCSDEQTETPEGEPG